LAAWHVAGKIKWRQTVFRGIEQAPNAFLGLLKGDNIGENAGRAELIRPVGLVSNLADIEVRNTGRSC